MPYAEMKNSMSVAHRFVYRLTAIDGGTVKLLWEGESLGEGEVEAEKHATAHREAGSRATIRLDAFKVELEKTWSATIAESRPPRLAVAMPRTHAGRKGKPRILYLPLEFPTWNNGGHSWSYSASLAYERAFRKAGCPFVTINTACAPYFSQILGGQRFDQVWFHCHPRHINDFTFRQLVGEIAPVRLMICGETVTYNPGDVEASPWFAGHTRTYANWEPFVTHVAMVDPVDMEAVKERRPVFWWKQAVPENCVREVNRHPRKDKAVFAGTLYPPRDRWLWDERLAGLLERVERTEGPTFCWLFEHLHEWIQARLEKGRATSLSEGWRRSLMAIRRGRKDRAFLQLYNAAVSQMRKQAFLNFQKVYRDSVAVVNLPAMVKTYSSRIVEAIAAGRPAISVRVPHAPIFEDGKEILHYGDDPGELAEIILRLKREPDEAIAIAERARTALLSRHTVEARAAEMLRFVEGGGP